MVLSDVILERLKALHPRLIDLSLERMRRLLAALGHPERTLPPVIHVAGTNGKGSVVAFLRAMLEAAGKAVHVYTSPHLVHFNERIRLGRAGGGDLIEETALCERLEECESANNDHPITFFEITTAAALLTFSRRPADYLLLEVGLGGRLDATNVVAKPLAGVITPVGLDHQQFLGETLAAIAGEKAGIMRAGVPCIVGPQPKEALAAIEAAARRCGTPLLIFGRHWQVFERQGRLVYQDETGSLDLPLPTLAGAFQHDNAGIAIAALRHVGKTAIQEAHIAQGLVGARWPARLNLLSGAFSNDLPQGAELWLDGGHNPAAAHAIAASMATLDRRSPRRLVLVWGMSANKDAAGYIRAFRGLARKVVTLTIPGEHSAWSGADLAAAARTQGLETESADTLKDALNRVGRWTQGEARPPRILICGSLYLAGHVLAQSETHLQA